MISLPQAQFRKAAQFASSVTERRNTIPVLSTIKVTANGSLSMEGTDLDSFVRATMPYEGDEGEFLIAEPAKVSAAIKDAGADTVSFEQQDKCLRLNAGDLSADLSGSIPADDFPASELVVEETFGATVGEEFFRTLARVRPAISTEETRYYLNGIFVTKIGDWLYRMVATDGHRLFLADVPLPDAVGELPDIIIPRRSIDRAIASFGKASDGARFIAGRTSRTNRKDKTLAPNNTMPRLGFSATIDGMKLELATKLIDGTFPDYTRVVPTDHTFSIRMNKAELLKALRCVSALSSGKTRAVRLTAVTGGVTVELHSPDIGKSRFPVAAEHQAPADFIVGLNARYLLDALGSLTGDEVEFGLTDPAAPMTITDPADTGFKVVQMPMRV